MQIQPSTSVDAFSKLQDTTDQVKSQVGISTMKQTLDAASSTMAQLMESLPSHLGQNVDARA